MKLPRILTETIQSACRLQADLPSLTEASPSVYAARLKKLSSLAVYAAHLIAENDSTKASLKSYITHWQFVTPKTTGYDLQVRGLQPGPKYKLILSSLRDAWLNGEINNEEEEFALLEVLLADDHI